MLAACEAGEVFALLEGGSGGAHDAVDALCALYGTVREPYVTRGLLQYHARTGSNRALELLARATEPHARYLLDALQEQLRADRPARHHALSVLAPLIALRPPWLHRLPSHPLARDLLRAARQERDPLPLLHALLALAALAPAAPALAATHPLDLADALLRPALLDPAPPPHARPHLLFAQRALFRTLYATHPCTIAEALRSHGAELGPGARDRWERALAALADSVRLHPALLTGSRAREADTARWARLELHDVVAETRRLALTPRDEPAPSPPPSTAPEPPSAGPRSPAPGSGAHAARSASALRPGAEPWFPLVERCGADSAPATPLPADTDAAEPPEAAVEATPENTPARETRTQFRFPGSESGAVRVIGRRSRGGSPPSASTGGGEVHSARLARIQLERRAADSPISFAGAPPPAVQRPEPNRPSLIDEPLNVEDREVLELTRRAPSLDDWAEKEGDRGSALPPARPLAPARLPRPRNPASAPRRSSSCGRDSGSRRCEVAVQTVDVWPEPYEFLIADFYHAPHEEAQSQCEAGAPGERLDEYLSELYVGRTGTDTGERVAFLHAQLMYERWRRDVHAERNRRLLGRCRQVRALELRNQALADRVRALTRERDELRARTAPLRPADSVPAAAADSLDAAAAELAEERAARLRAEAALHEARAARALDAADLQRQRAESFESARHVEALARAALAAERRAEYVRRLRRELLLLSEREARLAAAVRAPAPCRPPLDERALRAACARAESEAETATARAEAAAARAHELEAAVATREAALAELKRTSRAAAEESAARLRALRDKYSALLRVVRATEARRLEWLAGEEAGAGAGAGAVAGAGGGGAGERGAVRS